VNGYLGAERRRWTSRPAWRAGPADITPPVWRDILLGDARGRIERDALWKCGAMRRHGTLSQTARVALCCSFFAASWMSVCIARMMHGELAWRGCGE
jgi:hypothetical protein